jgi:sugar lactone lactonase YvrE
MRRIGWVPALLVAVVGCGVSTPTGDVPSQSPGAHPASFAAASPVGLAVAGDRVWAVNAGAAEVSGRTTPTSAPTRVPVGDTPLRAAYDGRLLWVSVFGAGRVVAIDPTTGRVVRRVKVGGQPEGLVAAFGAVWVVRQEARLLTRISRQGQVGPSYHLGAEPRLVTASSTALFVSNFLDGTVTRVDPTSGAHRTSGLICTGAQGLAVSGAILWITCTPSDKVVAVDTQTLRTTGEVTVPGEPDAIRLVGAGLYVVTTAGPTLVRIDADSKRPKVLSTTRLGDAAPLQDQANVDAVMTGGRWWVSSPSQNKVLVYTP